MNQYSVTIKGKYTPEEKYLIYADSEEDAINQATELYMKEYKKASASLTGNCQQVKQ